MEQRKEFMLLFRYEPSSDYQPNEAEINKQNQLWGAFIGNIALMEKLVSTHQLGFEGAQILANKTVVQGPNMADKQLLGGNMVVTVNSLEEATQIAIECPILLLGGTVEVRTITPMTISQL